MIQIQNGTQQGKFLIASVADDGTNDHIILSRVTNTGALDTSFSGDGHKQLKIGTNATVKGLFELANGKFIVYGNVTESTVVNGFIARIDQNGVLDNSFADNGIYTTAAISATSIQFSQAINDNSGKFIAVGNLESGSTRSFILRLTSTGVLDTGFNSQGYIIGNSTDDFASVIVDASNNLYAAGSRTSLFKDMLVIKYLNNGSIDTSFNGSGVLTVDVNILTNDSVKKITFDNSNNLYLIGNAAALLSAKVAVVKISTTGTLDTSFSGNGVASFIMAPLSGKAGVYDAVIDNNNNIVVVGFGRVLGEDAEMIGRIKANGSLDTSFNGQGYFEANVCTNAAQLTSVLLLSNNSLVVAGQCYIDATFRNDIEFSQYQLN
ncbi:hypothetical protein L3081_11265 [Colwellia sp. MSW7]|uniref:Delta-60 repeat domain-containing protein n=1 Tax=Colwellia maritima TaxID=2912588 RepID=A0ABS9X0S9_9GAMM|nr:hypothetical protein [Colwellia maritima]MCI2283873.1 hypothetical protein [Colwellia maritima]